MRKTLFAPGEYYHLINRGNNHQQIFLDDRDRVRFLFLILYFQSTIPLSNVSLHVTKFNQHRKFGVAEGIKNLILENRTVELINFALMPNHFHLTVQETKNSGISQYMQRVLDAYTKYFNTRYKKSGHLFQGPFKAIHVGNNTQFLYLSAYIHRNPRELKKWHNKELTFPWSSYQDYVKENRWGELLQSKHVLEQFKNAQEYNDFVETSTAKDLRQQITREFTFE
jgi:putative transposase